MRGFHVICGLPRSGSTLLANVLNQNERLYASSTSALAYCLEAISRLLSNAPEVKSDLAGDREATEARLERSTRAFVDSWYADRDAVVFDKSRSWAANSLLLEQLYPTAKMIVLVRDLRSVFASIEKQHSRYPLLDSATSPLEKTVFERANQMFSPEGIVGQCVVGVEDLLRRRRKSLVLVHFEHLVAEPEMVLRRIYSEIGEDWYPHQFDNVENTATDLDALYLGKFPHEGDGKVEERRENWREWISPDLEQAIMGRYPNYNRAFGYAA